MSQENPVSLYQRLGGYDAIVAVVEELLPRLMNDSLLRRFWDHRGKDGLEREKQLLIDFLAHSAGGPMYYTGRTMKVSHAGMRISEKDWANFTGHLRQTLEKFALPQREFQEVLAFVESTRSDIVDVA